MGALQVGCPTDASCVNHGTGRGIYRNPPLVGEDAIYRIAEILPLCERIEKLTSVDERGGERDAVRRIVDGIVSFRLGFRLIRVNQQPTQNSLPQNQNKGKARFACHVLTSRTIKIRRQNNFGSLAES